MHNDPDFTQSLKQRHTALILRLTLDEHNRLLHGVALDIDEQPVGKFRNVHGLVALLQHWLETRPISSAE